MTVGMAVDTTDALRETRKVATKSASVISRRSPRSTLITIRLPGRSPQWWLWCTISSELFRMTLSRQRRRRRVGARTLWSLAVLAMLRERSMHPYEMQRVMHQRHTDELLALKRGSLYHAINQLQREQLIEPIETSRDGRRPERTVYRITPDGEDELTLWMRELLSTPVNEPSQLTAALAFILHLPPDDALEQLELRVLSLEGSI